MVEYTISNSGNNSTICSLDSKSSDGEDTTDTFEVDEGRTREFTLTVVATVSVNHFAEVALESINWGLATDDTNAHYYTFNLGTFKTGNVFLRSIP